MSPFSRALLWALSCWFFVAMFAFVFHMMPQAYPFHFLFSFAAGASGAQAFFTERYGYLWGEE